MTSRQTTDWLAIAALFVAGLCAAMQFAKLSPIMGAVAAEFQLSLVMAGLSVSVLGVVGVCLAIAAGALVASIGLGRGLLGALFGGAVLAALGAVAPNAALFLTTRVLEGFSHLLIVVSAPALMVAHASARDRPIVLSLWACFFGVGFAVTSAVAPTIVTSLGWRGLLMSHAALLALTGTCAALVLNRSDFRESQTALPRLRQLWQAHVAVYKSGAPLLIALTFCAYTILFLATLTFLGRFLTEAQHWSPERSGSFMALAALLTLIFTLASGWLVRGGVSLLAGLGVAFTGVGLCGVIVFGFSPREPLLTGFVLWLMASFGLLPGFVFANIPRLAPTKERAALTYGAIAQFGNVGTFLGTPIFAAAYGRFGWAGDGGFIALTALAGLALAISLSRAISAQSAL